MMYAKISLTRHMTHEQKVVLYRHNLGDNPTAILASYEHEHPEYKRAETFVPYTDVWHYVLEQNFTCINQEVLLREWSNYRETSRPRSATYDMALILCSALLRETSLQAIVKQLQPLHLLLTDHEEHNPYAIESNRVLEYFLSECQEVSKH